MREALEALLISLPRCCACGAGPAVIQNSDRWWLCEACWRAAPCSDHEVPALDLRVVIAQAVLALRQP